MLNFGCVMQGRIASGEDVFGPLIEKYLLANKHRVTVQLLPDQQLAAKEDEEEKAQLAAFKQKLVDAELQEVIRSTQELKERQVSTFMHTTACVHHVFGFSCRLCFAKHPPVLVCQTSCLLPGCVPEVFRCSLKPLLHEDRCQISRCWRCCACPTIAHQAVAE